MNDIEQQKKEIISRFCEVKDVLFGGENRKMADSLGVSESTLSTLLGAKRGITLNYILLLIKSNKNLSIDWLINGEGPMMRPKVDFDLLEEYKNAVKERDRAYSIIDIWINTNKALYGEDMAADHNSTYRK